MILLVCATEFERSFLTPAAGAQVLVTGVGLVETTLHLTVFLTGAGLRPDLVIDFGVAGAYPDGGAQLLDVCLARHEFLGDLAICAGDRVEPFADGEVSVVDAVPLDGDLVARAGRLLAERGGLTPRIGNFVTVNCTSGSRRRGEVLARRFDGLCENMEGAAVVRVCRHFQVPVLEVRVVSNLVEDRDRSAWRLEEAARKAAAVAELLAAGFDVDERR